jgi:hypothetical protein
MTRCNGCDAEWTSRRWEHCKAGCHQTFASTKAGDAHRVGKHDVWSGPLARRCLEPSEMEAKGLWSTLSPRGVLVWHGEPSKAGVARRREPPS